MAIRPLFVRVCAFAGAAVLLAANWPHVITASNALEKGYVVEARRTLLGSLSSASVPAAETVRAYLQASHLSQGVQQDPDLLCHTRPEAHRLACRGLQSALDGYGRQWVEGPDVPERFALEQGRDRHAMVALEAGSGTAPMIIDTGSLATILPRTLHGAARHQVRETRVANLGRLVDLALVRTAPLRLGQTDLHHWVAATAATGFEEEGVLGLDMIYAMGGVSVLPEAGEVQFLHGHCPAAPEQRAQLINGALTALVKIDGQVHRALLDTGSVRSFVFNPAARDRRMVVRSDFGDARLEGGFRESRVSLGAFTREVEVVHTTERQAFYPGTTALLGIDVLLAGRQFGVCFEPLRFWII